MDAQAPIPFGAVGPPWWDRGTVYLVGGGPSLCGFDFKHLASLDGFVLGINQAMFDAPCCAGVSIDNVFVKARAIELGDFASRAALYLPVGDIWWRKTPPIAGAIYLRDNDIPSPAEAPGLSRKVDAVYRGATSGYAALNVAVLKRAKRIVLLGYDYGVSDGRHHYHDAYPWHHIANDQSMPVWAGQFTSAALACRDLGIEVVNASPSSTVNAFPKMSIEEALAWALRAPPS